MSSKPLKEWGIVKFLTKKAPNIAGEVIGGIADVAMGKNPVKVVTDRISGSIKNSKELSEEDKELALELLDQDLAREKLILEDRANARMTELKLAQSDTRNSRRALLFRYLLATFTLFAGFGMVGLMIFYEVPPENKSIIDTITGFLFGTGIGTILNYYFGSSEESGTSAKDVLQILKDR